jgi:hypothetical protein
MHYELLGCKMHCCKGNAMLTLRNKSRLIGILIIAAMVAGVLSVAPSVDSAAYLVEAAKNQTQVMNAALFQFAMALIYFAIAILLYPIVKPFGENLARSFFGLKVTAMILVIISTVFLVSLFELSVEFARLSPQDPLAFEAFGKVLKTTRDQVNHVFMILVLCIGNIALFALFIKSKMIPIWICVFGIIGAVLSSVASILVLFRVFDIITTEYLLMNAPTALADLVLSLWLIFKGLDVAGASRANRVPG